MFLSKVRARNFRNLRDLVVEFGPGLNVIVGENNIGKTNLLDAIRAALGPASVVGEPLRVTADDLRRGADGLRAADTIQVDLYFADLSDDERGEMLETLNYDAATPKNSTASIHYEWTWNERSERWTARRWGGERSNSEAPVPDHVLQAVPVTMLNALRDALVSLSPGRQSRLGALLRGTASEPDRLELEDVIEKANEQLQGRSLITSVEQHIRRALLHASGRELAQHPVVRASEANFDRIVNNLRMVLQLRPATPETPEVLAELRSNGLGYNNLLFIATVLAELEATKNATLPLLLVEEPEAHLHPQLQVLLSAFLEREASEPSKRPQLGDAHAPDKADQTRKEGEGAEDDVRRPVQKLVTTHSTTIASHVDPKLLHVLHREPGGEVCCFSLCTAGLERDEARKLGRMLDVTRAAMLFARGVILVEGITEALLLPVLAHRLKTAVDLQQHCVAVVPMGGVSFSTFGKLFGADKLRIPVAIVTDGDPERTAKDSSVAEPKRLDGRIPPCERVDKLIAEFKENATVAVFHSEVTLEYDLAKAGVENAKAIVRAWRGCYTRPPASPSVDDLAAAANDDERAVLIWRSLCLKEPTYGKADAAQALASLLEDSKEVPEFRVPDYIQRAIEHALTKV